jgi:hypothetical protein
MKGKELVIEKMCIAFANKQNQSQGNRFLNHWDDMSEEMRNELRIAMGDALRVAINGDGLLACKIKNSGNGAPYLTRNGMVVLFTKKQAEESESIAIMFQGEFVEYKDYYPTVLEDRF